MPETTNAEEFHIASLIVHTLPENLASVRTVVSGMAGVEAHDESEDGKLIVTVEADNEKEVLGTIEKIQKTDGTLSAVMVYHQVDTPENQEFSQDQAGDLK